VHRDVLRNLVIEHGLTAFTAHDQREICRAWHELDAWPDAAEGLARLRARYPVISLTILSVALIVNTSRKNRLDWDCVISCEMLGVYKPLPEAYRSAARLLGMRPDGSHVGGHPQLRS
jgi:2-haloacid dehalogenase